jgi:hypothetical protein
MTENAIVREFFDRYVRAHLARDEKTTAGMFAVPSLALFPEQSFVVSDAKELEHFFAGTWSQLEGVKDTSTDITVTAETAHSIWADVTWRHDNGATERLVYQLVDTGPQWKIAVVTPVTQ